MKNQKSLETILVLVLAQIIIFLVTRRLLWLYTGVALGVLALLIPVLADKIHYAWMKLAHILGYITSRIILTLIFFLVLFPLTLLSKFSSRHAMELKRRRTSTFKERNYTYTPESLENVW